MYAKQIDHLYLYMRTSFSFLAASLTLAVFSLGCAGPEQKFGRGINNLTEFTRLGAMNRSIEQTALWDGTDIAYTTGVVRGFNRSLARTALGAFEVVTFPFPPYKPLLAPKGPLYPDYSTRTYRASFGGLALPDGRVFPDSYKPKLIESSITARDVSLGFSGGDVAPFIPGSRFRIFEE
jgi:putative exosortase-associated protein (TIGR04073 family)